MREQRTRRNRDADRISRGEMMLAGEQILGWLAIQNDLAPPAHAALAAAGVERKARRGQNLCQRSLQPVRLQAVELSSRADLDLRPGFQNQDKARAMAARWAGVVPQHPPMIEIPASRRRSAAAAISSGVAS